LFEDAVVALNYTVESFLRLRAEGFQFGLKAGKLDSIVFCRREA
jgi:hypothetical protein